MEHTTMGLRADRLTEEITTFRRALEEHRALWGASLDRILPSNPIRNKDELRGQSQEMNRMLGRLRPYLDGLRGTWIMHHPATGITWDALEAAVGLSSAAHVKGQSIDLVLEALDQS